MMKYYAPVILVPPPTGPGNSGVFNFSDFKALLNACTAGTNLR